MLHITHHSVPIVDHVNEASSEMLLEMAAINFVMDPKMVKQVKMIIDVGARTAQLQSQQFETWMKTNGFWPDFHDRNAMAPPPPPQAIATSKVEVQVHALTILCSHVNEIILVLNMKNISVTVNTNKTESVTTFVGCGLSLYDTSKNAGYHPQLLGNLHEDRENSLSCEITSYYDEAVCAAKRHSSYCGVRLKDCQIIFLKRNTNEIQYYIRKIAIASFYTTVTEADILFIRMMQDMYLHKTLHVLKQLELYDEERVSKETLDAKELERLARQMQEEPKPSKFRFSLVALDS
jgi:vacuolar protein sorting-associated protein 13A/C